MNKSKRMKLLKMKKSKIKKHLKLKKDKNKNDCIPDIKDKFAVPILNKDPNKMKTCKKLLQKKIHDNYALRANAPSKGTKLYQYLV